MHRRRFLRSAAAGALGAGVFAPGLTSGLAPALLAQGAAERLGVGLVGCGGRGRTIMDQYFKVRPDIEVRGVCDVYEPRLKAAAAAASPTGAPYADYRAMLDRNDIH
ncbi:MAG: hypothetical protein HY721_35310, partial [Planctomycetes bacterium]|nr:hypothetical protein [Planctomycetota bacterium]